MFVCSQTLLNYLNFQSTQNALHSRDHMVIGLTTTYALSAYHHKSCEFEPRSWRCVHFDKVCQ